MKVNEMILYIRIFMKWMKSENLYTRDNLYTFRIFTTVAEVISASLENIPNVITNTARKLMTN